MENTGPRLQFFPCRDTEKGIYNVGYKVDTRTLDETSTEHATMSIGDVMSAEVVLNLMRQLFKVAKWCGISVGQMIESLPEDELEALVRELEGSGKKLRDASVEDPDDSTDLAGVHERDGEIVSDCCAAEVVVSAETIDRRWYRPDELDADTDPATLYVTERDPEQIDGTERVAVCDECRNRLAVEIEDRN